MDFDINDVVSDPEARERELVRLRREDPVHWDERNGFWLLTRHADVREASKQPELFSSSAKGPWHPFEINFSMQAMDGPEHRRQRGIVSRAFTPRMVRRLETQARQTIDECIDAARATIADRGHCDFVSELAAPVPLRLIADMLGLDFRHFALFRRWSDAASEPVPEGEAARTHAAALEAMQAELTEILREEATRRRREPQDDLLSAVVAAEREGSFEWGGAESFAGFAKEDLLSFAQFILLAGNETTRNAISRGFLALAAHPGERERLRADPALLPLAADEILRWSTPVRVLRRTLLRDTVLRGQRLRAGDSALLLYCSANRDEEVFDDPYSFRVDRRPNEHLAFGIGPHYCLGANLARLEIQIVIGRLLERLPELRPVPGAAVREGRNPILAAIEEIPVELAGRGGSSRARSAA
ncbi:cytochrome P450 [Myxococcota bacterium]|nr:cytochrome P450 [Myxococcota bacterium]